MRTQVLTTFLFLFAGSCQIYGQTKTQIIDKYIDAFNKRDLEGFLAPLADSVKQFSFPGKIVEKSKAEVRESYTRAFNASALDGQMTILGRQEIGDLYIIEESLQRSGSQVDQYILFKFSGDKIIEVHYLPKNFSWPRAGLDKE